MQHSCSFLNTCMKFVTWHIYLIEAESCMSWNPSSSLQYSLIWLVLLYMLLLTADGSFSFWKKYRTNTDKILINTEILTKNGPWRQKLSNRLLVAILAIFQGRSRSWPFWSNFLTVRGISVFTRSGMPLGHTKCVRVMSDICAHYNIRRQWIPCN